MKKAIQNSLFHVSEDNYDIYVILNYAFSGSLCLGFPKRKMILMRQNHWESADTNGRMREMNRLKIMHA